MAVQIRTSSVLQHARLYQIGDVTFWERTNPPNIEPDGTDRIYLVKTHDRFDILATRAYGDPGHWWIIAHINGFRLFPTELYPGTKIRIPTKRRMVKEGIIRSRA